MINLLYFKDELEMYLNVGYTINEALYSVYDDFSGQKWEYPKDLDDIDTMIKQDIKILEWFKDEHGYETKNTEVPTNFEKYFDKIVDELKRTKQELDDCLWQMYAYYLVTNKNGVTYVEDDEDQEILMWLCGKE